MDRRTLISGLALAPVAIAAPAVAQTMLCAPVDPVDRYLQFIRELNAGMHEDEDYEAESRRLYEWRPSNCREFTRKFLAVMGDADENGVPSDFLLLMLEADAKRLAT